MLAQPTRARPFALLSELRRPAATAELAKRLQLHPNGVRIALVSTDTTASPGEIIENHDERWSIEVCIEDAKQITGVGHAGNRVRRAVERTVPFGLLANH